MLEALAANTHLQELDCCEIDMNDEFTRDVFLPAVRANRSLRALYASEARWDHEIHDEDDELPNRTALREAEELVAARARRAR